MLIVIWIISLLISIRLIWIVEFITNPYQCQLFMTDVDLIYVWGYTLFLIIIPAIGLSILYIIIIVKLKKRKSDFNDSSDITLNTLSRNINQVNKVSSLNRKKYSENSIKETDKAKRSSIISYASTSVNLSKISKLKRNSTTSILVMAIVFFCCQLPIRIFLCWSYYKDYQSIFGLKDELGFMNQIGETKLKFINILSNLVTIIYFFHCISNSIIYNVLSIKFRKAFIRFVLFKN